MKLARHYQALFDSGKFENWAGLACHLGVNRDQSDPSDAKAKESKGIDQDNSDLKPHCYRVE